MSSRCWEPCDLFRGRWDVAYYKRQIRDANSVHLPGLREALRREQLLLSPRKGLIRALDRRIKELEAA